MLESSFHQIPLHASASSPLVSDELKYIRLSIPDGPGAAPAPWVIRRRHSNMPAATATRIISTATMIPAIPPPDKPELLLPDPTMIDLCCEHCVRGTDRPELLLPDPTMIDLCCEHCVRGTDRPELLLPDPTMTDLCCEHCVRGTDRPELLLPDPTMTDLCCEHCVRGTDRPELLLPDPTMTDLCCEHCVRGTDRPELLLPDPTMTNLCCEHCVRGTCATFDKINLTVQPAFIVLSVLKIWMHAVVGWRL